MNIDEQIAKAIAESHPNDLSVIRRYIAWVKVRRKIHDAFYRPAHWVRSSKTIHWIGHTPATEYRSNVILTLTNLATMLLILLQKG